MKNLTKQMEMELEQIMFYLHSFKNENPSLEGYNKLFDNLTKEEWNNYINCILNY